MSETKEKKLIFYNKARVEYEKNRPATYQFSLTKEDPKSKKFRILLYKMIEVFKEGMKAPYKYESEQSFNYWQQLQKHCFDMIEMKYIMNRIYQGKEVKIIILFMLLLNNKKIFNFLHQIVDALPYLYEDPEQKKQRIDKDIQPVDFFKDGQFTIIASSTNYIADYRNFWEEEQCRILMFHKEISIIMEQLLDKVEKNQRERIKAEELALKAKQKELQEQKQRQIHQQKAKDLLLSKEKTKSAPEKTEEKITGKIPYNAPSLTKTTSGNFSWEKKPRGMKNSQFLYHKKYQDELECFSNKGHPFQYQFKISQNKQKCTECKKELSAGFYFFGGDMNLCQDTGMWFCNDCMADERMQIPHKAKRQFDLRGYPVSRRSYQIIKLHYEMPLIEINHDEKVVFQHKILYDFLVLKRQLHLMYDSICNIDFMERTFPKRIHYFLRKNLFSLKNLYDVYNGHETPQLEKDFAILQRHFYKCDECQRLKGKICHTCNAPPKIFAFELRDTYSCKHCRNIYHRRCLKNNLCPCERQ